MFVLFAVIVSILAVHDIGGKHLLEELQKGVMSANSQRGKEKILSNKRILIKEIMRDATISMP